MRLTDLPGHEGKMTSDKKMIFVSCQRYKGRNRDYSSHFSVIFDTASKFPIVFVRLIWGKVGVDRLTGSLQEIEIRYEFDLKVI